MSFKYNVNTLKKLETLFEESRYTIRYEKGNFNSNYCILEDKRIAVINKFLNVENRINVLLEILSGINVPEQDLATETLKFYHSLAAVERKEKQESQGKIDL